MKLLVPIDFSPSSEAVISQIESRPCPPGTEVRLLHIIDMMAGGSMWVDMSPYLDRQREDAQSVIGTFAARLSARGIKTSSDVVCGYPSANIPDYAKTWSADLVMVGSHGQSALARFLLGSVAKSTLRAAPCSVEVVRPPAERPPSRDGLRILVAIDGSDCSKIVPGAIASLPWPAGSQVRVITIFEPFIPAVDPWYYAGDVIDQIRQKSIQEGKEALAGAAAIFSAKCLPVSTEVIEGHPKAAIVDDARSWEADLVVLGSHGRHGLERLVLGSVAEAVALHAHCSVRVIRAKN